MAQNKRSASSLFSSFLDPSLINDDELLKAKTYVRGASRFEISESDKLNEKEKHLCHDLQAGNYSIEVSSLGTGKFQVIMRISKTERDVFEMAESTLSGVGKHSKFTKEFSVTKEQEPVMFDLFLKDRSRFYQKASYNFKLTRTSDTTVSPVTATGSGGEDTRKLSASKLKPGKPLRVKLYIDNEIRYKAIALNARFEELKKELDSEYGERQIKYTDMENDVVTIRSQEDLENFFTTVKQDQTPKLVLESPQSPMSANTMRTRLESTPTPLPVSKSLSENMSKQPSEDTRGRSQSVPKSPLNVNTTPSSKSPSSQPTTPAKGTSSSNTVRNWSIGPFLGAGAFAKVYLGMNLDNGQLMAVKQIDLTGKVDPEEIRNLEREIELMSQLSHDHIVRYHGMEKSKEYLYIFLDYVPGGSLESILHDFALSEAVIRRYTVQILKGLKYLHDEGVIHRDIKAGNILVNESGTVYLADFGCSKKVANALQQNKSITGTPNYLPLEVIQKQQYTKATDIWSLGCTLIEMFTRKPPWHHVLAKFDNPYSFFYWLTTTTEELEIPENISGPAKDFLRKCLKKNPEERASVEELLIHPFVNDEYKEEPSTSPLEEQCDAEDATTTEAMTETEMEPEFDPFADVDDEYHSDEEKKSSSATSSPQASVTSEPPVTATTVGVPASEPQPQPQVQPTTQTSQERVVSSSLRSQGSMFTTVSSTAFNIAALAKVASGRPIESESDDEEEEEEDDDTPQSLEDSPHPFELMSLAQEIKAAAEASSPLGRKFKTVSLSAKKSESSLLPSKGSSALLKHGSTNTIKAIKPAKKKVKKSGESEIQSFLKRNAVEQRTMYNLMKLKQGEEDKKKQPQKQQSFVK